MGEQYGPLSQSAKGKGRDQGREGGVVDENEVRVDVGWTNPTVGGIQQRSKQSFQSHHPGGVANTPPQFFFFNKFIGKMLYFSVKKGLFTHIVT
jgi:hypothetical protein